MGAGISPAPTSPWVWECNDNFGLVIRITVTFNNSTRAVTGGTVFRDAGCQWTRIIIGPHADGTYDKSVSVPAGTTNITAAQFAANGINVIEDILYLNGGITAAP